MKLILSALLLLPTLSFAQNQKAIDGNIIVRIDSRDNSVSMATTDAKLANADQASALAAKIAFSAVPAANQATGELDREAGASSWYCYNYYNYSYLYWYGGYYQPYYSYNYSYYSYYYYNSYGWWRW